MQYNTIILFKQRFVHCVHDSKGKWAHQTLPKQQISRLNPLNTDIMVFVTWNSMQIYVNLLFRHSLSIYLHPHSHPSCFLSPPSHNSYSCNFLISSPLHPPPLSLSSSLIPILILIPARQSDVQGILSNIFSSVS